MKQILRSAHDELFARSPDERFDSFGSLWEYAQRKKEDSADRWHSPTQITPQVEGGDLVLSLGNDGTFLLNDWSFSQICRLSGISKETINRLSSETARRALEETLPGGNRPLQVLTSGQQVRSIHGTQYTRLWDLDLLAVVREFATDFVPPQEGIEGGTGLYAGEQDMFCFLIDPAGWTEIDGEAFAPGFFLWNSEVGRRSLGIQTFWFQKVCRNHLVWDAVEVVDFTRKHTANVHESLGEIRRHIESLVAKRDQRKDRFAEVIKKAMTEQLGSDAEEVEKVLTQAKIARSTIKSALELAKQKGAFTIWSLVDALTRLAGEIPNAGDRSEADARAATLLALVS
jgi:hypothetical protein